MTTPAKRKLAVKNMDIEQRAAYKQGFTPVTNGYNLDDPEDMGMYERAKHQFMHGKAGPCTVIDVTLDNGEVEIWRLTEECLFGEHDGTTERLWG